MLQKMTNHGEWFAIAGAAGGWGVWLHHALDPVLLILSVILSLISLYLVVPKFIKRLREDIAKLRTPKTK